MGTAKTMVDAVFGTGLLIILFLLARATPLGFLADAIFTPVGMVITYLLVWRELVFIRL